MRLAQLSFVSLLLLAASVSFGQNNSAIESASGKKFRGKVRIGVEAPLSGDQKTLGEGMLNGAQLAADHLNALGGIKRKEVIIVPIDDAADPEVGVAAAKAAVKQKLKGVVGPYNSGVGIQTLPIYMKKGLLPIRLTSNNATDGMGYTLQPMSDQIAPMAAEALTDWLEVQSVGIIYDSTQAYTNDIAESLKGHLEQAGVTISAYIGIAPGANSYSSEVSNIAALDPDVIYAATYFPEGGLIAKAMYDQQVSATCVLDYGSDDPGFITVAGIDAAMEAYVVGVPSPTDFPDGTEFAAEYETRFGTEPGTWSPYTYDSLMFLADGVHQARTFRKKPLKKVLDKVANWQGVTGSVTIDPETGNRIPATLVMLSVNAEGQLIINKDWAEAVGAPY